MADLKNTRDSSNRIKMLENKAQEERYEKLLDDVLFAVAVFYSKQMSDFLILCGEITNLTIISIILLALFASLEGVCERRWSNFHGSHSLWYDVLKAWLSTGTRTLAFLAVNFLMEVLKQNLATTEHSVVDIFVEPFVVLFLLIAAIKYTSCVSIEAHHQRKSNQSFEAKTT